MRTTFTLVLMLAIILAGTYWLSAVFAVCQVPLEWRIGKLDGRFNITHEEARNVIEDAASVWEDATDRNLFSYDEDADFTINFMFDERQRTANEADALKDVLDDKQDVNESLSDAYAALVAKYQAEQIRFEDLRAVYNRKLNAYNNEVESYNQSGGAPPDVFEALEARKEALNKELVVVNNTAQKLNQMATEINQLGQRGNELIEEYNQDVNRFNERYGYSREFTQGDYQGDRINIYTFQDEAELTLVLAHELGHALSLDHVDNDTSVMYYLMGGQAMDNIQLTAEDQTHFQAICGDKTGYERLRGQLIGWLRHYGVL